MELGARIRERAAALGFSACGFAAATPVARGAFLDGWLGAGFAGEMHYLERRSERRLTVRGIVPDARTVITLAHPYDPPRTPAIDWRRELRGRIAAYAHGEDYHRVIERKLCELETFLAGECPGSRTRRYVDTGAVLEREWAVRGGLGWFGKNTMLLSSRRGSWFFLAELVTTVPLTPDFPKPDHCGRCTRCLEACPTGALRDGLVLDARVCIAYLTIEHRGAIPRPLRRKLGPWIFGCDVCQDTCPWNDASAHYDREPDSADSAAATAWISPYLPDLLALDETGFHTRFARTALNRAKRRGLLRNVAVVLGNSGNPAAIPALARALADPDVLVRGHAAWALGALRHRGATRTLERARRNEDDPAVLEEMTHALNEARA